MLRLSMLLSLVMIFHHTNAKVTLPAIFTDHMVLQRDKPIAIWGWGAPNEKVTVRLKEQSKTVSTDSNGQWKIILAAEPFGGPFALTIEGSNKITLTDVLIGDVWLCSGQSNMEWPLRETENGGTEIAEANFSTIRHIKIPNTVAAEPQKNFPAASWEVCSPSTAGSFTAVGYYFAKEITKDLKIPIGLINSTWGGTHVETWTSRHAFESSPEFQEMISKMRSLDLDSLSAIKNTELLKKIKTIQGGIPSPNEIQKWSKRNFDDSSWPEMNVPQQWESQTLGEFDGVVWLRKTIMLDAQDVNAPAHLCAGKIDDSDETFINGTKVGGLLQHYNELRSYAIQPGILRKGANVIAIRIEDTGAGGGVHGEVSSVRLVIGDRSIPLHGPWKYHVASLRESSSSVGPNSYPTLLFNAMIHPLLQCGVTGVLWYQGESNADRAIQYRQAFPLMINDWRNHFAQGDIPFYFVQLASFGANNGTSATGSDWAELREAQLMTLSLPNTGMVVTTDIGDPSDIHPRNKKDVGKRLAALALNRTYNIPQVDSGPILESLIIEGNRAILKFTNIGDGLITKDDSNWVKGFEVAGDDRKFFPADARIEGDKIIVSGAEVANPVAVRYGWADDAGHCNLFNKEGFPATPFRTDDWKGKTADQKFSF